MTETPNELQGFLPIKKVAETFATSRSTVDRRRLKAFQQNDEETLRRFRLRTRDGVIHELPTREQVQQFIKNGMVPEWFVSKAWLKKEYGHREEGESRDTGQQRGSDGLSATSADAVIDALKKQYEARIDDLKHELTQERQEKRQLLEYAQHDKQLFGSAVSNLTKVLTLPGMASAIDTANRQLVEQSPDNDASSGEAGESEKQGSATTPQPKQSTDSKASTSRKKQRPKSKRQHGKWFSWRR